MSNDQDVCEWVNVSSGIVRIVPDKRPLKGCACFLHSYYYTTAYKKFS